SNFSTFARAMPRSLAAATMALAIGCSDKLSTAATSANTSSSANFSVTTKSVSFGMPSVSVPVLSTATTAESRNACKASPLRNKMPRSAPRPVPTIIDVGVAKPIAQGQATINTATAFTRAKVNVVLKAKYVNKNVAIEVTITAGTTYSVTVSTKAWIGSLAP